ncbi:MAG: hypothetical protein WCD70_11660 [Alphaproteobacteria bacterium]
MNASQLSGRLGWLASALAVQRNNLANVLSRLKGFGIYASMSFALRRKFTHLLEQVADDKEKELDILNEIEAVEKHHQAMKQMKLLRRATPKRGPKPVRLVDPDEKKPERNNLLTFIGLLFLFSQNNKNNKKQKLTSD